MEIQTFVNQVTSILKSENNKHDSVLFFISAHGDSDGVILDSNCEEIQLLSSIFNEFFGKKCECMIDKPKVFFIDACRGDQRMKRLNDNNNEEKSNDDDIAIQTRSPDSSNAVNGINTNNKQSNENNDNRILSKDMRKKYYKDSHCRKYLPIRLVTLLLMQVLKEAI